jgi:hypothetical protein
VDGEVSWNFPNISSVEGGSVDFEILDVGTNTGKNNPYRKVRGGFLKVRGTVISAQWSKDGYEVEGHFERARAACRQATFGSSLQMPAQLAHGPTTTTAAPNARMDLKIASEQRE